MLLSKALSHSYKYMNILYKFQYDELVQRLHETEDQLSKLQNSELQNYITELYKKWINMALTLNIYFKGLDTVIGVFDSESD